MFMVRFRFLSLFEFHRFSTQVTRDFTKCSRAPSLSSTISWAKTSGRSFGLVDASVSKSKDVEAQTRLPDPLCPDYLSSQAFRDQITWTAASLNDAETSSPSRKLNSVKLDLLASALTKPHSACIAIR